MMVVSFLARAWGDVKSGFWRGKSGGSDWGKAMGSRTGVGNIGGCSRGGEGEGSIEEGSGRRTGKLEIWIRARRLGGIGLGGEAVMGGWGRRVSVK
jgi:hypothetical protein